MCDHVTICTFPKPEVTPALTAAPVIPLNTDFTLENATDKHVVMQQKMWTEGYAVIEQYRSYSCTRREGPAFRQIESHFMQTGMASSQENKKVCLFCRRSLQWRCIFTLISHIHILVHCETNWVLVWTFVPPPVRNVFSSRSPSLLIEPHSVEWRMCRVWH